MEDSFIIANFHSLCRLCLKQSSLMVSIFESTPDDENSPSITSKISECIELQMKQNDGLPGKMCYKCLFKLDKCSKFKIQCIQSESRLRQISNLINELDHSHSTTINYFNSQDIKPKVENTYFVEDSVVMVVDPSMEYDSSEESENIDQVEQETQEQEHIPEGDPTPETLFKNVFMCQYCDKAFITDDKCKEHEQTYHDPNLPYKCVGCNLVYAERCQFVQHIKQVHVTDKPYQCSECDKAFGRRSDLRKHAIVHTGVRPYQCQYCLKSFSRNTNLSKHLRIHAGTKPHVCPLCPRSFVAKGDLQRHIAVHTGKKPYTCNKCPMSFERRDKLLRHEIRHRTVSPDKSATYETTNMEKNDMVVSVNPFNNIMTSPPQQNSNGLEYDLPRVPDHISGESSFINQIENKQSTSGKQPPNTPTKQKSPISNKNKPKNIKCHQCPKRFSSLDAYKTHVSIAHIGSRVFHCKVCFKKFSRKRELDRHAILHVGVQPLSCTQCDKTFTRKDKLVKHEQSHECTVVNMPCIECGATFEKKEDLVAHIKSHFSDSYEDQSATVVIKKEEQPEFPPDENLYDLET